MRAGFLLVFLTVAGASAQAQDAREIVRMADARARGKTSESRMTIQVIRPGWKRELGLKTWSQGNDLALVLVTAPAKDKGIVYLKRKKEVWNWIPSIERNIKLPPSMMSQSWMGTDFTNDDLVKEASIVEDYVHTLAGEAVVDGYACYLINLVPKPEAAVVWGKVLLWIDKKDHLMLHAEYYDEAGKLVNTLHGSDVKMLGGRLLPSRLEMVPAGKKGQKTVMIYESLQFDRPLSEQLFSTSYMSRVQ
jgi:outer membrane lipoprotein-sorting protein